MNWGIYAADPGTRLGVRAHLAGLSGTAFGRRSTKDKDKRKKVDKQLAKGDMKFMALIAGGRCMAGVDIPRRYFGAIRMMVTLPVTAIGAVSALLRQRSVHG